MKIKHIEKIIYSTLLTAFSIVMLLPVLWMLSASFKFEVDVFEVPVRWIPKRWNFNNYPVILTKFPYVEWYINTFKVAVLTIILTISVATLAGYAFARLRFRGKNVIFLMFIATMMVPGEIRVIPQFILFRQIGLFNTHAALVLPWMFNIFSVFFLRQFYMTIPYELTDAARIDGCGEFKIFYRIILPLTKPVLVSLTVLIFTWAWNNYMAPLLFITEIKKQVLAVGITYFQEEFVSNVAMKMAGVTLGLVPITVLYFTLQRYFIEGIVVTGIKT